MKEASFTGRGPIHASFQVAVALALGLVLSASIQAQRTATAVATVVNGFVVAVTVTDAGAGYTTAPEVTITGGGGSGAAAKALLSGDAVGQIIVLMAGSGYTSVPDVLVAPPAVPVTLGLRMVPQLTIHGEIWTTYQVQWADAVGDTNLWMALTNVVFTSSPYVFYDTISAAGSQGFYRAVAQVGPQPGAPPGFVWIQPGTFVMGSADTEQGHSGYEEPQTTVTLTRGFFLGRCEVTQEEYVALVGANPSYFTHAKNLPVECVSWRDATNYCAKLTAQEGAAGRLTAGWEYRLPTEAQWEYACRAGTTTRFSFGDDPDYSQLSNYTWWRDNLEDRTQPVGQKQPNPWGLYDMHGNVAEWCWDDYGTYPGGSVTDPVGPSTNLFRVNRGGWYGWDPKCWRSAVRWREPTWSWTRAIGFRVALVPAR